MTNQPRTLTNITQTTSLRLASAAPLLAALCVLLSCFDAVAQLNAAPFALSSQVNAAVVAKLDQIPQRCSLSDQPGFVVNAGLVQKATLIEDISGYAGSAATTGGLGGRLVFVTNPNDYDSDQPAIVGSLRWHVEMARQAGTPMWIAFAPSLGSKVRITLKRSISLPSNITIDGTCMDVTLDAPSNSKTILLAIRSETRNVIIARMALQKTDYFPERHPDNDSAIRLNGEFDRIAILYNDLSACGDGCIDITVSSSQPLPPPARITVAYNFLHDHDKVMLFGTFDCRSDVCDQSYLQRVRTAPPRLFLTLEGNLFLRTSQRHPRTFGRVMAHITNNVIAFKPMRRAQGFSASDGVFVSNAGRAFVDGNVFMALPPLRRPPLAVWTTSTPGAMKMPDDVEGFIRLGKNTSLNGGVIEDNQPSEVPLPPYPYKPLDVDRLSPEAAMACLARAAGRTGNRDLLAQCI